METLLLSVALFVLIGLAVWYSIRTNLDLPDRKDPFPLPDTTPVAPESERIVMVPGSIDPDTIWPPYQQPRPRYKPAPTMIDATPVAATSERID